jgi:hypothetical protein
MWPRAHSPGALALASRDGRMRPPLRDLWFRTEGERALSSLSLPFCVQCFSAPRPVLEVNPATMKPWNSPWTSAHDVALAP